MERFNTANVRNLEEATLVGCILTSLLSSSKCRDSGRFLGFLRRPSEITSVLREDIKHLGKRKSELKNLL